MSNKIELNIATVNGLCMTTLECVRSKIASLYDYRADILEHYPDFGDEDLPTKGDMGAWSNAINSLVSKMHNCIEVEFNAFTGYVTATGPHIPVDLKGELAAYLNNLDSYRTLMFFDFDDDSRFEDTDFVTDMMYYGDTLDEINRSLIALSATMDELIH